MRREMDGSDNSRRFASHLVARVIFLLVFWQTIVADHQAYRTAYGCEGATLSISCEPGHVINVIRANYGRFSITICNPEGNTEWSVNCQSPRTHRVLIERCSGKSTCNLEVSSENFGDPCAGTVKYIEMQYTCGIATTTTTTTRPRPPWFAEQRPPIWFPPVVNTSLPSTIPAPKALPTSSTLPTTAPPSPSTTTPVPTPPPQVPSEVPLIESTGGPSPITPPSPPEDESVSWCSPTFARGLYWNWTKSGEMAVLSCPGGATGSAQRKCIMGEWAGPADLSDCRSAWLTNLEARASGNDAVLGVSTDLAKVTSNKSLYGGDLMTAARLLKTLSRRMMHDAAHFPQSQQRQAVVTEFLLAALDTGSALLSAGMAGPWGDLSLTERRSAVTALMIGLEEASFLLASVLPTATQAAHFKSHVLASTRSVPADGSAVRFPSREDSTLDWVFTESVSIPPEAVLENSEGRATRVIFLTFRHLEDLLAPHNEVFRSQRRTNVSRLVNSRVVSASLGHGRHIQLPEAVVMTFSLLRHDNVSNPVCVFWDYTTYAWNDEGCLTLNHNRTHVTCKCDHLTNFAVIMDEASPAVSPVISPVKVVPYIGCLICIFFLSCSIVMFTLFRSSPKTHVQKHVSVCVVVAEVVFLFGIWRTDLPVACGVIAGVMHYSILAAFLWMFIEGLQIYMCVCRSSDWECVALRWWYYMVAYGGPLVVVCGAAVVDPFSFGTANHCWLRTDNYFVFSLLLPVALLMVMQVILMAVALVRTCTLHPDEALKSKQIARLSSARAWLRNTFALLLTLALTWSCALLLIHRPSLTAAVLFCVFNCLYGLLAFISHCITEHKVREWCHTSDQENNAWIPQCLRSFCATEKQTYSPNNNITTTCSNLTDTTTTATQYLPPLCQLGGLKGAAGGPASHQQVGSRGSTRGYASASLLHHHQQQQRMPTSCTNTTITMATPPTTHICPTSLNPPPNEEDSSYKSFSRDSGHGGSEQEDSPRTPWGNRAQHHRYINSADLKTNYLERMNTLNKLNSPYIDTNDKLSATLPNSYTVHPPVSHLAMLRSNPQRANSPWNHTYMEIENRTDPVYEEIERERWAARAGHVSDLSDEDVKRATPLLPHHAQRPKDSQFSLSEQRLRDFNAAQMSLDLQHLQNVHDNLSRENLMTVAVLNGEQVVCRLSSPSQGPPSLPIIHEGSNVAPGSGYPAHIIVSRPQYVANSQDC